MSVLVITNKLDTSSDVVIQKLYDRGVDVFRLNTEDVGGEVTTALHVADSGLGGDFANSHHSIAIRDITSVYYRRPRYLDNPNIDVSVRGFVESEVRSYLTWLWRALSDRFWVSSFSAIRNAESKIDQLRIAPSLGFHIPDTVITNRPDVVREFYEKHRGKIINKVLSAGAISLDEEHLNIYATPVSADRMMSVESVSSLPCLFQAYIEKKFELRITVVGEKVFAAEIHSQQSDRTKHDWRRYDLENTPHRPHVLPAEIERRCLDLVKYYGLMFGAIDMIVTPDGQYVFLEINPNGQWGWIEHITQLPISSAIADLLVRGSIR